MRFESVHPGFYGHLNFTLSHVLSLLSVVFSGICGITIATDFREGASDSMSDIETGELVMDFEVSLHSHPIFSSTGGFPERVVKRVAERSAAQGFPRSRLPDLSPAEVEFIKGNLIS